MKKTSHRQQKPRMSGPLPPGHMQLPPVKNPVNVLELNPLNHPS